METLRIYMFGGLRVLLGERPLTGLETRKTEALLVYLACNRGPQPRDVLADLLWDERSQQQARANLRVGLASLRKQLDQYFAISRETISLNPEAPIWTDVCEFESRLNVVRKTGVLTSTSDAEEVEAAVALYRGDFLAGFYVRESREFDRWQVRERERLIRMVVNALHELVGFELQSGRYPAGMTAVTRLLELDPISELAHRQMMQLLAYSGRRSEGLAQYETCRRLLWDELGIEPSVETQSLHEKIRLGDLVEARRPPPAIRGYQIEEQIGSGSYGAVYRAFQLSVGREVAVKAILPQYANAPEFIRRFEVEAQMVARLEHPYIVPLYDYWREPDGAYLVMRLLKGGNLVTLLESGPLETVRVLELVDQIAAGLSAAHRQGVIHRDLKPANILFDEAGNVYISDFGIAEVLGGNRQPTQTAGVIGTPAYLSPEQFRMEPVTLQSDLYSFGIILYQMLTGKLPFPDETLAGLIEKHLHHPMPSVRIVRADLPEKVDQVIQKATAKDPAARYPDAKSLAASLRQAVSGLKLSALATKIEQVAVEAANPYKGLRAFQEADEADFFGRERLVGRLVSCLGEQEEAGARFLAVVGPSGSGKSSLVKAGLIPALRRGAILGSDKWFVLEMLPGSHPFEELEINLMRIATNPAINLGEQIHRDHRGLLRAARLALPSDESELLLVIDQFEEVFTLVEDKVEADDFLENLYVAVTEPRSPVRVVITLRADFFDRPLLNPGLSRLVQERTEVVIPLVVDELERAIRAPAERAGLAMDSAFVAAIVADMVEQPGALPLLQYALTEIFKRRKEPRLTLESYLAIGGVKGVLERRAEEIFAGLGETEQAAARQVFLRLVTLGEGVSADGLPAPDTRRRVLRSELESVALETQRRSGSFTREVSAGSISEIVEVFGKARLLSFDRDPITRSPTVEIAHEALLKEWPRLRQWLDESRDDLRMQRALTSAAAEWSRAGRDTSFLLHGARLSLFESWAEGIDLALTGEERFFLEASLAEREAQRAAEEARLRHEAELTEQARHQACLATARELALASNLDLATDPERSIMLALQSLRTTYTRNGEEALRQALQSSRVKLTLAGHRDKIEILDYSPDGSRLVTTSSDGSVKVWDSFNGHELLSIDALEYSYVAFSPDGHMLAAGIIDGRIQVLNALNGDNLRTLHGHTDFIDLIAFSPDGKLLSTASNDGTMRGWDFTTGQLLYTVEAPSKGFAGDHDLAYFPDGQSLLITDFNGNNRIIDAATGQELLKLLPGLPLGFIRISSDGSLLATARNDGFEVDLWDLNTLREGKICEPLFSLGGFKHLMTAIAFSPDGSRFAAGSLGGVIKVWELSPRGGLELMKLNGHKGVIYNLRFSPDGSSLASASHDRTAKVWDLTPEGSREVLTLAKHGDRVNSIAFSPSGSRLATASFDEKARIWDGETGQLLHTLTCHVGRVFMVSFHPGGVQLASCGEDFTVRIWDANSGQELLTLIGHEDSQGGQGDYKVGNLYSGVLAVVYSPDGRLLASTGEDGTARIWDAKSGALLQTLTIHPNRNGGRALAFSPDGASLAVGSDDWSPEKEGSGQVLVTVWDVDIWQKKFTLSGLPDKVLGLAFSPDGLQLATVGVRYIKIWDAGSGQELFSLPSEAHFVTTVYYSPDGSRLVTAGIDPPQIWDLASRQVLVNLPGHTEIIEQAVFNVDGNRLATASRDGTARIYTMNIDELIAIAEHRLTRWFTPEECRQFLHQEECPPH